MISMMSASVFVCMKAISAANWAMPSASGPAVGAMTGMRMNPMRLRAFDSGGSSSLPNRLFVGFWAKAWIPASKRLLPLFIEHPRADLQQQMSAALAPLHLLVLDHSFAHHLIHRRLHKAGRDPFPVAIALSVVGHELLAVIGWQRKGFGLFWNWKIRHGKRGRPAAPKHVRQLIRTLG